MLQLFFKFGDRVVVGLSQRSKLGLVLRFCCEKLGLELIDCLGEFLVLLEVVGF